MPTHRAKVTFRAKEGEPEPCILVEQLGGDADIVPDNFYFDLPRGTSLKEAETIAERLRQMIDGVALVEATKRRKKEVRPRRRNT
jgi:hypothetical protein